jgi:hypothetical protein
VSRTPALRRAALVTSGPMRTDMSPAKNYNLFVTRIPKLFLLAVLMSLLATALGSSRVLTAASAGGGSQNTDAVWFWFGDCLNGTPMGVRITVEGQNVYHSTFRACRMERVDANTEKEKRIRVFHFPGGHTFQDRKLRVTFGKRARTRMTSYSVFLSSRMAKFC